MSLLNAVDLAVLIYSVVVIYFAYTLKGLAGFGSGLLAVPLLALVLPLTVIVPALGLISYSGTILQSIQYRRQAAWKDCLVILPFSVLGVISGLYVFQQIRLEILNLLLGLFVSIYALVSLIRMGYSVAESRQYGRKWGILAGFAGGLVGTLFGTGGPFYVIYLKLRRHQKHVFRASIAIVFLLDGAMRIIGYSMSGFYNQQSLLLAILGLPILLLGLYTGHHIHLRLTQQQFSLVINLILLISGLTLTVRSI